MTCCTGHRDQTRDGDEQHVHRQIGLSAQIARAFVKAPIVVYRWTARPWLGWPCRHTPTCSDYAIDAIDRNGAWAGLWLTVSRLARCHPFGTAGFDPVPDTRSARHGWRFWRHGRWTGSHMPDDDRWT